MGVRHGLWLGRRLSACCCLQLNPSSPGGWGGVPVRPALSPQFSWEAFLSSHLVSCHLSSDVFPNLCLSEYLQSQSPREAVHILVLNRPLTPVGVSPSALLPALLPRGHQPSPPPFPSPPTPAQLSSLSLHVLLIHNTRPRKSVSSDRSGQLLPLRRLGLGCGQSAVWTAPLCLAAVGPWGPCILLSLLGTPALRGSQDCPPLQTRLSPASSTVRLCSFGPRSDRRGSRAGRRPRLSGAEEITAPADAGRHGPFSC